MKEASEKICLCKAVQVETVKESIRKGATSLEAVAKETGAGNGACKGGRCKSAIYELIKGYEKGEWQ